MRNIIGALSVGLLFAFVPRTSQAVPVVPNFTQGSMTSHTETTSTVTETINSIDYNTGYQYSVTGTNVTPSSGLSPSTTTSSTNSLNGVTSTWTGLNIGSRPTWGITNAGQAFQFTESYQGPGISNQTIIQRTTEIRSVTDTTSIFMQ